MSNHFEYSNSDKDGTSSTNSRKDLRRLWDNTVSENSTHGIPATGTGQFHANVQESNGVSSNTNYHQDFGTPDDRSASSARRTYSNDHESGGSSSTHHPQDFGTPNDRSTSSASRFYSNGQGSGGSSRTHPPPRSRARPNDGRRHRENTPAPPPSSQGSIAREQSLFDDHPRRQNKPLPYSDGSYLPDPREYRQQQYPQPHNGHCPNGQCLPHPDRSYHHQQQYPYGQNQHPPQPLHYQAHHQHSQNPGWPRSAPPNGGDTIPSFSTAFGNAVREYESLSQYPSRHHYYLQDSAQAFHGYAFGEGQSGSQGHHSNMVELDCSMTLSDDIHTSEPPPCDGPCCPLSHTEQSYEDSRSNTAQRSNGNSLSSHSGPSNGDVSMESDMAMETETEMDTQMHHDPQPSPNKGKDKAAKAPKDDKCNDKAVDGSPENVKMEIIHETGRADPTKNRKRGRPVGSKNKPKSKPDGQSSEFNEAEATKPKGKANKASKPKGTTKDSKPTDGTKCRANKRACNHAVEDEVDQLKEEDDQDDTDKPEPTPRRTLPLNDDHPSGPGGIPPDSPSNPGGPGGPGGPPGGLNDSNYNSSGTSGSPLGTPSNPGNPGRSHPPGGPDDSVDGPPQDHGYRYGGEGTTGGTSTTPPGSPIPPNTLLPYTPSVDTQLREFMNFMFCHQDGNGAVFHPQRGLVCYECHNQQQFQTFCNEFSATFGNPTNVSRMNILNGYRFEMRIKLDFHWTNKHLIRLSNMLQDVRTLYRLDLHVCTAEEINASRLKSPSKKCKITRTTCCTSELMDLIHRNPNIREVRFRGVGTFFIRDFTHVPTMNHVRVLEMDVDAWIPLQRYASGAYPAQNPAPYCKRFDQVLLKLSRLELLVLHCPDVPGAFMERLVEMKPMMSILSHAKNIQHQPQIQRGGFLVRLKAHGTASAFEIGRLDADGNMTDVHAVFTNSDHANVRHWITDSRVPETSAFRGLFSHSTLWSHVERLTTTGRMPVWCMDALKARKNHDQMTQLHGMALQSIAVENEWWGHFLDLLTSLQLQIFVLRDCAFPGNMLRAAEEPTDWTWLFDAVGQQGQVIGLGLVDTRFGDGGELLLKEFWNLVDAREIQEQNAEGQMVSVPRPRWGALKWVDISGSVDTDIVGWGMYRLFLDSQVVRNFHGVHVMDPDHFIF